MKTPASGDARRGYRSVSSGRPSTSSASRADKQMGGRSARGHSSRLVRALTVRTASRQRRYACQNEGDVQHRAGWPQWSVSLPRGVCLVEQVPEDFLEQFLRQVCACKRGAWCVRQGQGAQQQSERIGSSHAWLLAAGAARADCLALAQLSLDLWCQEAPAGKSSLCGHTDGGWER